MIKQRSRPGLIPKTIKTVPPQKRDPPRQKRKKNNNLPPVSEHPTLPDININDDPKNALEYLNIIITKIESLKNKEIEFDERLVELDNIINFLKILK